MNAVGVAVAQLTKVEALGRALAHLVEVAAALACLAVGGPTALKLMVPPVNGTVVCL